MIGSRRSAHRYSWIHIHAGSFWEQHPVSGAHLQDIKKRFNSKVQGKNISQRSDFRDADPKIFGALFI